MECGHERIHRKRYQAEALIHGHVPIAALLGAVCYTAQIQQALQQQTEG